MRHWLTKHLKALKESDGTTDEDDDDVGKGHDVGGVWAPRPSTDFIVRTRTVALLPEVDALEGQAQPKDRTWRSHLKQGQVKKTKSKTTKTKKGDDSGGRSALNGAQSRRRTGVGAKQPAGDDSGDLRARMARNPSFARSRYVLTNTGAWARVAPSTPLLSSRQQRRPVPRSGSAEARDPGCPPGLFLIRYLDPGAASLLARGMQLVDGRWVKVARKDDEDDGEDDEDVLDLGDEEELRKWAEEETFWQPLAREFDVDDDLLEQWRRLESEHKALGAWATAEQDPQYIRRFKEDGLRQMWVVRVVDRATRPPSSRVPRYCASCGVEDDDDGDDDDHGFFGAAGLGTSQPSVIVQHQGIISLAEGDLANLLGELTSDDDDNDDDGEDAIGGEDAVGLGVADDDFEDGLEIPEAFGLRGKWKSMEDASTEKRETDAPSAQQEAKASAAVGGGLEAGAGLTLRQLAAEMGGQATRKMVDDAGHTRIRSSKPEPRRPRGGSVSSSDARDAPDDHRGLPTALNWLLAQIRKVTADTASPSPLVLETFLEETPSLSCSSDDDSSWN